MYSWQKPTPRRQRRIDPIKERFFKYVELIPFHSCWEWVGAKNPKGYGRFGIRNVLHYAHRVSYEIHKGPISHLKDVEICHTCDNPSCVNPNHLWLGDKSQNMKDCYLKGRHPQLRKNPTLEEPQAPHSERTLT